MNYLAVLGRQPELGLIELESILGSHAIEQFSPDIAVVETLPDISRLGGVLKLARIIDSGSTKYLDDIQVSDALLPLTDTKLTFGISVYADQISAKKVQAYGLTLKKQLKSDRSVRLISSDQPALSAAHLKYNHVLDKGFELIIAIHQGKYILALTNSVQDIDAYTERDHGRPARSAKVGMLPPKLAQVLINTTGDGPIYDPFCGTGVILQEALLMGRPACGSDLAPDMVAATHTNIDWLAGKSDMALPAWSATSADARSAALPTGYNIASEGYLGPHLTSPPDSEQLQSLQSELAGLYLDTLANFSTQLPSGGRVSICIPAWKTKQGFVAPNIIDQLPKLGYTLNQFATVDQPVIYARPDQIVARQLLLLAKQ